MQIVLKVWSSNSHYGGGCDYAVVERRALLKLAFDVSGTSVIRRPSILP